MKKLLMLLALLFTGSYFVNAQDQSVIKKELADSICNALNKVDMTKIVTQEQAVQTFSECFMRYQSLLLKYAEEQKVEITDNAAMRELGMQVGKDLMRQNCEGFMKISVKMAAKKVNQEIAGTGDVTQGTLKRIENKGFNYLIITDATNHERSFLWLREFTGSEKFTGLPATYKGKKVKIKWQEIEVYIPQAKAYYKVKEITAIDIL